MPLNLPLKLGNVELCLRFRHASTRLTRFLRTKIQRAEWEKLETLNKRRTELESRILSTMRSMERHTMNICSELSAMFEGRIEEIKGSLSAER